MYKLHDLQPIFHEQAGISAIQYVKLVKIINRIQQDKVIHIQGKITLLVLEV